MYSRTGIDVICEHSLVARSTLLHSGLDRFLLPFHIFTNAVIVISKVI